MIALLAFAACTSNNEADPTPTPRPSPLPIAIDWANLVELDPVTVEDVVLKDCEGDAPLLCVERDGNRLGSIELGLFPRDPETDPQTLEALAKDHRSTFASDRREGCPSGYSVRSDATKRLPVAGLDGIRTGFTVLDADGKLVEHNITYFAIDGDRLVTLGVEGLAAEGSCLELLGGFDAETVGELLPIFDRVAMGSVLPEENV